MKKCIFMITLLIVLAGCSKSSDLIKIGIIRPSLNHLPLQYALQEEILDPDSFEIIEFLSGWETNEALIAGKVDLAIMPFTYAWIDVSQNRQVKILSCFERESDAIVCKQEIDSLEKLQNKSIGVLKASTLEIFTLALLAKYQLETEQIPFRTPFDLATALTSKEVDAISYYVPSLFKLSEDFHILHWFSDDFPHHPCCDLVASMNVIETRKKELVKLMHGLQVSCQYIEANPEELIQTIEEIFGIEPETARKSLEHTRYIMSQNKSERDFEEAMAEIMLSRGYLKRAVTAAEVFYEID